MRISPALLWHRWFGVLGGAWLFVIAFTGCLIVFQGELDRVLNPELFRAQRYSEMSSFNLAATIRAVETAWPGSQAIYVGLPRRPGDTAMVALTDRPDSPGAIGPLGRQVYVDAGTGLVQGSRVFGGWTADRAHLMPFIYRLHYELHAGQTVRGLLGILALLWLVDHLIAVPLALRSAKRWTATFKLRRNAKTYKRRFDLHRAGGMWLLPVTAVLAFSGIYFNLSAEFMAILRAVAPPSSAAADSRVVLEQPLHAPPLDADATLAAAYQREPGLAVSGLGYDAVKGLWTIYVHHPRDLTVEGASRTIVVDALTGSIIDDRHFSEGTAGDAIVAWQFPLHSGKILGWPGRILVLLAGITTCTLVVTGYVVWWRKRLAKRKARSVRRPLVSQQQFNG